MEDNEEWRKFFYYDETSPTCLRWAVARYGGVTGNRILVVDIGDIAGCLTVHGYGEVKLDGASYKTHRIIYEMFVGQIPAGMDVDHLDGNRRNNTPSNLRLVRDKQNAQNRFKRYDNTSGKTGVTRICNKSKHVECNYWMARWTEVDGKEAAKAFRIEKFGNEEAFRLACEHRDKMIEELNREGQFYTERHGEEVKC